MKITLSTLLLVLAGFQCACCVQSFSYPIMADVLRIEVVTAKNVNLKEIDDPSDINSIVRFIDERRARWCSPTFAKPDSVARLDFYFSPRDSKKIGLANGYLVIELASGKNWLSLSSEEQQELFRLLSLDQDLIFKTA